jgi:hypothetical protein
VLGISFIDVDIGKRGRSWVNGLGRYDLIFGSSMGCLYVLPVKGVTAEPVVVNT